MTDALRDMKFRESEGSGSDFLSLKDGETVKIRIFTTNPMVHLNQWGKEQYTFAVWDWTHSRAAILSKGITIAKEIYALHNDEDWGADITQLDVKLGRTGTSKEDTRYSFTPVPKPQELTDEIVAELTKLDANLEKVIKSGIRASEMNDGIELPAPASASEATDEIDLHDVFGDE